MRLALLSFALFVSASLRAADLDLESLESQPADFRGAVVEKESARLTAPLGWGTLQTKVSHKNATVTARLVIEQPAKSTRFFGESWSVWPDATYSDGGFDGGVVVRASADSGYRIQLSHKLQEVTLVKWPQGGYLRSVPCRIELKKPIELVVSIRGPNLVVAVDGAEKIHWEDRLRPLAEGAIGIGAAGQAIVRCEKLSISPLADLLPVLSPQNRPHTPKLSHRKWVGDKTWIFDGDEPIQLLHTASYINNVKLIPGYKPLLSWNSYWEISNQGAFPEGAAKPTDPIVSGDANQLTARWTARHVKDRFEQRMEMKIGWDATRQTYTYDIDTTLEVLPGPPFHFRYGYDFEHHTPLDPFPWKYLLVKREGDGWNRRPVNPFDPGVMTGVEQRQGARVWYGRHRDDFVVAPAVEYHIDPEHNRDPADAAKSFKRKLNTAVCAAFYDTGVSFEQETAPPGTKVRVRYRYTGVPAEEAKRLFEKSQVYESPTLDPKHHFIFADTWPKLSFAKHVPLSEPWPLGHTPFLSGHNERPRYELAQNTGIGSGFAIGLGPQGYAVANLPAPAPLAAGRYIISAMVKSENTHGPGGYLEIVATKQPTGAGYLRHSGSILKEERHYLGAGTFGWKKIAFVSAVPSAAPAIAVGFGNAGTGRVLFAEVEFRLLTDDEKLPADVLPAANNKEAPFDPAPRGAIADFRMREGDGLFVYDHARGPFGLMQLSNVTFTRSADRPALKFADNTSGQPFFARSGTLERSYLATPGYRDRQLVAAGIAGTHGGSIDLPALSVVAQIKPAAEMGTEGHRNGGDIVGVGARRFILRLAGAKSPYRLQASLNVNDRFESKPTLDADRWYQVAMVCTPQAGKWRVRLFVDGQQVHEGVTEKMTSPTGIPPSVVLGTEIFYFHDSFFRGELGRTTIFHRELTVEEIKALAP